MSLGHFFRLFFCTGFCHYSLFQHCVNIGTVIGAILIKCRLANHTGYPVRSFNLNNLFHLPNDFGHQGDFNINFLNSSPLCHVMRKLWVMWHVALQSAVVITMGIMIISFSYKKASIAIISYLRFSPFMMTNIFCLVTILYSYRMPEGAFE